MLKWWNGAHAERRMLVVNMQNKMKLEGLKVILKAINHKAWGVQ